MCINDEQWEHHFEKENYLPVKNFTASDFEEHIDRKIIYKTIMQKFPLHQWNDAHRFVIRKFYTNNQTGLVNFPRR